MKVFELIEEMQEFLCKVAEEYKVNKIWLCSKDGMHPFWESELNNSKEAAIYMASCFINFLADENMMEEWNYLDKAFHGCLDEGGFGNIISIFIEESNGNKTWIYK